MKPLVGIIMGSASDWETMQAAADLLDKLGVAYEVRVVSAHRTPDLLFEYAAGARARGLEVLIAGAGGAAHLPGMTAAKTSLPVLGVPVQSKSLGGLDSLLSIVQMPAGVPVATFAIGPAGATNAALCAAAILANRHPDIATALEAFRERQTAGVLAQSRPARDTAYMTVGIVGAGQLGRMLALAGYPLGLDFLCLDPAADAPAGAVAPLLRGAFDDRRLLARLARACEVMTFDWENVSVSALAGVARAHRARICPPLAALAAGQDRVAEKRLFERLKIPTTRWQAVGSRAELGRALEAIGVPGVLKTRRLGYDGKGQAVLRRPADAERAWRALGSAPLIYEEWVPFDCEASIIGARSVRGEVAVYPLCRNVHGEGILRLTLAPYGAARLAAAGGALPAARAGAFPLFRDPDHRVLRTLRAPDRQRDGAARAQLRALDHRGRRHQSVREPPARHPRPAAGRDRGTRPQCHDQPHRAHTAAPAAAGAAGGASARLRQAPPSGAQGGSLHGGRADRPPA